MARFTENAVRFQWQKDDRLTITAGFSARKFTTLRDHFSFLQTTLTAQITPQHLPTKQTSLWLTISSNRADELNKNSYTTIDNLVLTSAKVQKPEDLKVEFGLNRGIQLSPSTRVLGSFSAGATDSRHSGIAGNISRGACDYQFKFHENGGVVNQVNQCGNITTLNRIYPNDESVEADFGVSPVKDFRNKSIYGKVGIGFRKDYNKWSFTSRYYYQRYFRDASGSGDTTLSGNSYNYNQVFSVETSHRLTNNITVAAHIEY